MVMDTHAERECQLFVDHTLIGTTALFNADPSMSIAMGVLRPGSDYAPDRHAHERAAGPTDIDPDRKLCLVSGDSRLEVSYRLEDFSDELPEDASRQIHITFPDTETYEAFFRK